MSLTVLYDGAKGMHNALTCDHCGDHCGDEITNDQWSESVALHKVLLEPLPGMNFLRVWTIHVECIAPFIEKNNFPEGRWYVAYVVDMKKPYMSWYRVDMERLEEYAQGKRKESS